MSDARDETICDVSATLLQLLKGTLGVANVALAPPRNATTLLTLFLYKVRENPHLRNDARRSLPVDVDGKLVEQEPPLMVDLYYLLTAHHATDQLEAHRALSRAMRVFYDNAILRGSVIQATKDRGLTSDATLRITLDPISMEDMTRIWSAFPDTQYEISVTYLVTPVPIESSRILGTAPVVDQIHRQGHLQGSGAGV
jgi:Pvc16 N-terminal domain